MTDAVLGKAFGTLLGGSEDVAEEKEELSCVLTETDTSSASPPTSFSSLQQMQRHFSIPKPMEGPIGVPGGQEREHGCRY